MNGSYAFVAWCGRVPASQESSRCQSLKTTSGAEIQLPTRLHTLEIPTLNANRKPTAPLAAPQVGQAYRRGHRRRCRRGPSVRVAGGNCAQRAPHAASGKRVNPRGLHWGLPQDTYTRTLVTNRDATCWRCPTPGGRRDTRQHSARHTAHHPSHHTTHHIAAAPITSQHHPSVTHSSPTCRSIVPRSSGRVASS